VQGQPADDQHIEGDQQDEERGAASLKYSFPITAGCTTALPGIDR
jgi:hypothetical protein